MLNPNQENNLSPKPEGLRLLYRVAVRPRPVCYQKMISTVELWWFQSSHLFHLKFTIKRRRHLKQHKRLLEKSWKNKFSRQSRSSRNLLILNLMLHCANVWTLGWILREELRYFVTHLPVTSIVTLR